MAKTGGPADSSKVSPAWGDEKDPEANDAADEGLKLMDTDEPDGCWAKFTTCFLGFWATRQLTSKRDREGYVRTTIRELVIYIIFLVVVSILSLGMCSSIMYYFTRVMTDLFVEGQFPDTKNTMSGSTQVMDIWRFAENILLDGLYWENWYDTVENEKTGAFRYDYKGAPTDNDDSNVLYENKLLGKPRIRQIKVSDEYCNIPEELHGVVYRCFGPYSEAHEDKETFTAEKVKITRQAWIYQSKEKLNSETHWGKLTTYGGGGFAMELESKREKTKAMIEELKDNLWIERGTRVVFFDFTVYNANINLFCVVKLAFEIPPTGGLVPSWTFRTVKLLRYVEGFDYVVLVCEFLFAVFILYYIVEEFLEIRALGTPYFCNFWNILDILVILVSLCCVAFSAYRYKKVDNKIKSILKNKDEYANFEFLAFAEVQFNNAVAITAFFAWIKLFKYISFNKTMTQLNSTLSRCANDVAGFAVMFFIVFFAFAQLGYLLFGTQVYDYSSFTRAVFTLLRIILGDFNFNETEQANRLLGPIYFLTYVFFVFFVLLNMFLAIINDTYGEVKAEIAMQKNEFEIADYFKREYNQMMGKMGRRDRIIDVQNTIKLAASDTDGSVNYEDLRKGLKKCNFSDMEIEMFFAKYNVDSDRILSEQETKIMMAELEGNKFQLEKEIEVQEMMLLMERPGSARPRTGMMMGLGNINNEEFDDVQRRVNKMENNVNTVGNKIDQVLQKLEVVEKAKHKRRETMSKILDSIAENDSADEATKRQQMEKLVREELERWDSDTATMGFGKGQTMD